MASGSPAFSQEAKEGGFQLRAVLHDPLNPYAELYVPSGKGELTELNLAVEGLTESQKVWLDDGVLRLYSSATIDPEKPLENLAAEVKMPQGAKRAIALIFPAKEGARTTHRMMVVRDDAQAFPPGETRVVNLTGSQFAVKAGGQSVKLPAARVTSIPLVKNVNDLNQAQTEFYLKGEGENEWLLVAERPMQFTKACRNIVLIYRMPRVAMPKLRTLIDTELR